MKVFARIKDGKIVEYPVYEAHIKNRAHPYSLYVECVFATKPTVPEFHYLAEDKAIQDNKVYVSYRVLPVPLPSLLKQLKPVSQPGQQPALLSINDIKPEFVQRIITLTKDYVQSLLDKFAAEKGFTDMVSLVSYKDSTNPEWSNQATIGIAKRDQTWSALYQYLDDVMNSVKPIPKTEEEIYSNLPELIWV